MEEMMAVFHLALIVALSFYLRRKYDWNDSLFWPALVLKLVAGLCLGLLYRYYFEAGDTFVYFTEGGKLAAIATHDLGAYVNLLFRDVGLDSAGLTLIEPRALFFTKMTSVLNIFTGSNYWAISFYYSFVSFLGAWFLVRVITANAASASLAASMAFLFFPSVVFWTSGVLKESVAMAAMFFLAGMFLKTWFGNRVSWWEVIVSMVALWVFWKLKYYYAGAFIPIVISALIYRYVVARKVQLSAGSASVAWLCLLILPLVLVTTLHPNFNVDRILGVIVANNEVYIDISQPGEYVQFQHLTATPASVMLNAPWALFSGLFRPLLWETSSLVQIAQAAENAVLLVLFIAALSRIRSFSVSPHKLLVLALIVFITGTCVLITLSAPNFGTLSRYRVGYVSFFAFLILCNNPFTDRLEGFVRSIRGMQAERYGKDIARK